MAPRECRACGELTRRSCGYCEGCEYMTLHGVAKRLQIAYFTAWKMSRDGRLRAFAASGGKVLIARAEVDAMLEGRKWNPQESKPTWEAPSYPLARRY